MALALPSATPAEAASAVRHLRGKGWTEEQLAEFILPYMPREARPPARGGQVEGAQVGGGPSESGEQAISEGAQAASLPSDVTRAWLDDHLPAMDRRQLRLVVDELERRGWPSGTVAMTVLPHLLPRLPDEDVRAVVAGLADLGMTDEEIARATTRP